MPTSNFDKKQIKEKLQEIKRQKTIRLKEEINEKQIFGEENKVEYMNKLKKKLCKII